MKTINIVKTLVAGLTVGVGMAMSSCTDSFTPPATPTGSSLNEILSSTDSTRGFGAALTKVGLSADFDNVNSGQFTMFAPTNYAIIKYLRASGIPVGFVTTASAGDSVVKAIGKLKTTGAVTIAGLQTRINYHIVSSSVPSSSIPSTGLGFSTIAGTIPPRLSISHGSNVPGVTYPFLMNANLGANPSGNGANVLDNGTAAANGVVYQIDRVMNPVATANIWVSALLNFSVNYGVSPFTTSIGATVIPKDANDNTNTYYDISTAPVGASAADTAKYTLFTAALVRSGLASSIILNGVSIAPDYTVFAPTDGAFFRYLGTDLSGGVNATAYSSARSAINAMSGATLKDIVKYHILNGRILTSDLSNGLSAATWLTDKNFTANVNGTAYSITDLNASSQNAVVSSTNNLTNAGVVHGIRRVLLPQ